MGSENMHRIFAAKAIERALKAVLADAELADIGVIVTYDEFGKHRFGIEPDIAAPLRSKP